MSTRRRLPLPGEQTNVSHVFFVSSNEGWILAKRLSGDAYGVFHTLDSGHTWQRLNESEIIQGLDDNTERTLPPNWKAGNLFQLLLLSNPTATSDTAVANGDKQ